MTGTKPLWLARLLYTLSAVKNRRSPTERRAWWGNAMQCERAAARLPQRNVAAPGDTDLRNPKPIKAP